MDRSYPFASTADGTRDPHHGVEFVNKFGTPVYAAEGGVVIFAGADDDAIYSPWRMFYGNLVVIQHDSELFTLYAHLSRIVVEAGDAVELGQKIGEVGQSGVAIGSHLHFEVRRGAVEDYFSNVNPELWLFPSKPDLGALAISIQDVNSTFQRAKITLQHYSASGEIVGLYYLDTYHPAFTRGEENVGINDLPAGRFRITLIHNGGFYERWVEVQSGKLTKVVIVVK
ncbi:MAG: M23 family metallopeptidase [Chloroflexota bacterium]